MIIYTYNKSINVKNTNINSTENPYTFFNNMIFFKKEDKKL